MINKAFWKVYAVKDHTKIWCGNYDKYGKFFPFKFSSKEEAEEYVRSAYSYRSDDSEYGAVRVRKIMSFVKAVKLLTDSKKNNIELWMQPTNKLWKRNDRWLRLYGNFFQQYASWSHLSPSWHDYDIDVEDIMAKYIVVDPFNRS